MYRNIEQGPKIRQFVIFRPFQPVPYESGISAGLQVGKSLLIFGAVEKKVGRLFNTSLLVNRRRKSALNPHSIVLSHSNCRSFVLV